MPKTLDDIQTLLTRRGYTCKRMVNVIVATTVVTKIYKNPAGENALEIVLTIDHPNRCVAVEVLRAFELREANHKGAVLACLMTAAGRTPLLRPTLESEGTVGLRIDCTCGRNGARDGDVLQAVALLESWVEVWFPQVTTAMTQGMFNPNEVPHLNLLRMGRGSTRTPTTLRDQAAATQSAAQSPDGGDAPNSDDPQGDGRGRHINAVTRAAAISERPGAHPNRLRALFEFFRHIDEENRGQADQN